MIPKEAIYKAIEGGWKTSWVTVDLDGAFVRFMERDGLHGAVMWERIALDPSFWQCLGKALGWPEITENVFGYSVMYIWAYHALRFYRLLLDRQSTDIFWQELLADTTKSV